jgi:hypothetical protein
MKDFFKFREQLLESVNMDVNAVNRKVAKYFKPPVRPAKRPSAVTREVIVNLMSFDTNESAKAVMSDSRRAKVLVGDGSGSPVIPTLPATLTYFNLSELRKGKEYIYFLTLGAMGNTNPPQLISKSIKKIPPKDLEVFAAEYEFTTYTTFKKNWMHPDNKGAATGGGGVESKPKMYDKYSQIVKKEKNLNDYVGPMQNAAYGYVSKLYDPPTPKKFQSLIRSHWNEEDLAEENPDFVKKNGQFDYQKFLRDGEGEEMYSDLVNDETWDTYDKYGIDELNKLVEYKGTNKVVLFEFEYDTNDPSLWFLVNKYSDKDLKCLSGVDPSSIDADEMARTIDIMVANGELKI